MVGEKIEEKEAKKEETKAAVTEEKKEKKKEKDVSALVGEKAKEVSEKKEALTLAKEEKEKFAIKEEKKDASASVEEKKEPPALVRPEGEKVFTIPLRKAFRKSKNRRKNYAVSLIKEFLLRHTKAEEVKLGSELNRFVWEKGKPPRRIRVKAVKEGSITKAELLGFEYKDFKAVAKKEKKGMKERLLGRLGPKALKKEEEEKMVKERLKPAKPEKIEKHEVSEE